MANQEYKFGGLNPPIPFLTGDASVLYSIISEVNRVNELEPEDLKKRNALYLYKLMSHFSKVSAKFPQRLQNDLSCFSENSELTDLLNLVKPADKYYFQRVSRDIQESKVPKHHLPLYWATTSGSTGVPLKIQRTSITGIIGMAQVPWMHLASDTDFSWKVASVKPSNTNLALSESWDPASGLLFKVGPLLSVPTSEDVFRQLEELERFQPDMLIVFPSVLKEYVSIWDRGIKSALGLKVIRTMGETLCEETRQIAEELTGADVLDTYSSTEVGRIATQIAPRSSYVVNGYSLIVEVLNERDELCLPGEIGRVVVTDLFNYATPLIRYDIGDWAVPQDEHHRRLESIKGRSRNMITLPDGRKIWPLIGYREFSEIVPIRQFHIRQVSSNSLEANFFIDVLPSLEDRDKVDRIIKKCLGYDFNIKSNYQTTPLRKLPNHKLEDFVSLVT